LPIDENLAEQGACTLTPKAMPLSIFLNKSEKCTVCNFFVTLGAGDAQALEPDQMIERILIILLPLILLVTFIFTETPIILLHLYWMVVLPFKQEEVIFMRVPEQHQL